MNVETQPGNYEKIKKKNHRRDLFSQKLWPSFPKMWIGFSKFDKHYDKKVLGILIGDLVSWKCDLVSWECDPVSLKCYLVSRKCDPVSWKEDLVSQKWELFSGIKGHIFRKNETGSHFFGKSVHQLEFLIPYYDKFWETRSHFQETRSLFWDSWKCDPVS